MHLFYTPNLNPNEPYSLSKEESAHAVRVLRLKEGNEVLLSDGEGNIYTAEILQALPQSCVCSIKSRFESYDKRDFSVRIAVAPTKNNARMEWFAEKATEMGINEITLFKSTHSERVVMKTERLEKVVISALKQSYKAFVPRIAPVKEFKQVVDEAKEAKRFIATCEGEERVKLKEAYCKGEDVIVLIGPEGDFSKEEISYAVSKGFRPLTLGEARLRTETAALYALQGIHFVNF